ncbi:MAG: helix-turn-helix domain-containing protein, partial [Candidatus Latescibacteria bacterium]|nr:helix-turn-helix domain-containing protein [Candidatus Latescibacterota bacterium]
FIFAFVTCSTYFVQQAISIPQDTIPPEFTWVSPVQYSIQTTNNVRLCIEANDNKGGSGIKKVIFYASYVDEKDRPIDQKIGEVSDFPFELTWNCSHIQDQSQENMQVYCEVIDNAGNVSGIPKDTDNSLVHFVLDRNPILNSAKLLSYRQKNTINLDGNLHEWAPKDSVIFSNNDNTIIAYSSWDKKQIYFGIRVKDRSIINQYYSGKEENEIFHEDIIEIYIDVDHDHYPIRNLPDRTFLISPSGAMYQRIVSFDGTNLNAWKEFEINTEIHIQGTLNNEHDEDSYYIIELAIPWEYLGIQVSKTSSIGLGLWNCDKDYLDGDYYYAGWTTRIGNQENPSEWGDVVFISENNITDYAIILFCMGLGFCAVILSVHVIHTKRHNHKNVIIEKACIVNAKNYIDEHYANENLSREEVARFVGLTPPYFGNLFKEETGVNFTEYLLSVKIDKAKYLLLNSDKNISEIAFQVGFCSPSYFGSVFKKKENISPKEFRKKNNGKY